MDNMKVTVVNRKTYAGKDAHYVGRPTILGNPFTVKQHGHGVAIDKFKTWLNLQWTTNNKTVIDELTRLAKVLKDEGEITLSCWCHPNPCHADVIGQALQNLVERKIV